MSHNREFQIFAKPVGAVCNLSCLYCYYLEKEDLYTTQYPNLKDKDSLNDEIFDKTASDPFPGTSADDPLKILSEKYPFKMSDEILERYIIQHIKASSGEIINFSWHGGEPLIAGIPFYKLVVELQKKYVPSGKKIINGIQTNGTLLNVDWCSFLASENFIVGISLDGPEKFHDLYRQNKSRQPSFEKVIEGLHLLKEYGITFEILCVVHSGNAAYPLEVYRFFRELGAQYMTFLPLVIQNAESIDGVSNESVRSEEFGNFMIAVFDEWVMHDIGRIKVQLFEEAARTAFNQDHTLCIFKKECGGVPVVEHNGDFYSCDHYVNPEFLVGNILDTGLGELLDSKAQKDFGRLKLDTLPRYCLDCEVRSMCNGECPKNRFIKSPDGEPGLNYLCVGYKKFFNHCRPFVNAVAAAHRYQSEANKRDQSQKTTRTVNQAGAVKINRNAPCPCGSGKKYKRCCL
jgi:uncharacterized protein